MLTLLMGGKVMHVLLSGGTGFIGQALAPALAARGHAVTVLTRRARSADKARGLRCIDALERLDEPLDAVINLAGASLAGRRWSAAYKREIVASRVAFTRRLGQDLASFGQAPQHWLNASAIGFYGPQAADTDLAEDAAQGEGFAARLCADWEAAARAAAPAGARVVLLRLGVVLHRSGGAFQQMAAPFRLGVAHWMGSGRQLLSWIHRDDAVAAIGFLLDDAALAGAYNLSAPQPVSSREFCRAMRRVYTTLPAVPMPAALLRVLVGEMADELLLSGQRVRPEALTASGFHFRYPGIDDALAEIRSS